MALDLADYESKARSGVKAFWRARNAALTKQKKAGRSDQGERGSVTAGKNMNGFAEMILAVVRANGLAEAEVHRNGALLALPGFYRPTKLWDLLVMHKGVLVAAIELKSQVGPSFGNNFNNRAEEAIGTAQDLWTAYREGALGEHARPFVGWLMHVEDAPKSRAAVKVVSPHFSVFEDFVGTSYLARYDLLCRKLMQERLYTAACVLTSSRDAVKTGHFVSISDMAGLGAFITTLAGHIAAEAARKQARSR